MKPLRDGCPEPQLLAAHLEGRLSEPESESLLEHCAACDDCRRELGLTAVGVRRAPAPADPAADDAVREAVLRAVERNRTTRRARPRQGPGWAVPMTAAAAGLAAAFALWSAHRPPPVATPAPAVAARPPDPAPSPEPLVELPVVPEIEPAAPTPNPEMQHPPEPSAAPEPPPTAAPEPPPAPTPAPAAPSPQPEAPPARPSPAATRTLASVTLSDVGGDLLVRRRGARDKERPSGRFAVGDGDTLIADKSAAFFLVGRYAIALTPQTQITLAMEVEAGAPLMTILHGEALVDSGSLAGCAWRLASGGVRLSLDRTRGQFAVAAEPRGVGLLSLAGNLTGRDAQDREFRLKPGERLDATAAGSESKADAAAAARKRAQLSQSRPRERTLVHVPFDGESLTACSVAAGDVIKERGPRGTTNEVLRAADRKDSHAAAVKFGEPVPYQRRLMARLKVKTNIAVLRVGFAIGEKGVLFQEHRLDRKSLGAWTTIEMELDEGFLDRPFLIAINDPIGSITVGAKAQDVFGDGKGWILVDDVQVFVSE